MFSVTFCPGCNCAELGPQPSRCERSGIEMDQSMAPPLWFVSLSEPAYPPQCSCRVRLVVETLSPDWTAAVVVGTEEAGPPDGRTPDGRADGLADGDGPADGLLARVALGGAGRVPRAGAVRRNMGDGRLRPAAPPGGGRATGKPSSRNGPARRTTIARCSKDSSSWSKAAARTWSRSREVTHLVSCDVPA